MLRHISIVDGKAVGNAAQSGDALAVDVVRQAGYWLGLGIVNLLHVFNPHAIALGGSVTHLGDLLLNPAKQAIREHVLDAGFYRNDLIRYAALGDDTGLIGAAAYAQDSL